MKDNTNKKAPKVPIAPANAPFKYFQTADKGTVSKSPMGPMVKKRLSK